MITIVPMTEQHVRDLRPQAEQMFEPQEKRLSDAMQYAEAGPAFAALSPDGVICVGGTAQVWPGRGIAWSLVSADAGPYMLALTRAVRRVLDAPNYKRLEMYADAEHPAACRWAEILGFELETPKPIRAFSPSGRAAFLYARIK